MKESKKSRGLIWLIVILMVVILGLMSFVLYDILTNKNNNKLTSDNKFENDYVAYCYTNKNDIFKSISKFRNNSFISKFAKDEFININLENIICDSTEKIDDNKLIIRVEIQTGLESFVYDLNNKNVSAFDELNYVEMSYKEYVALEAFVYAKEMVSENLDQYGINHIGVNLATLKDSSYNGDNIYILKICEYEGEQELCNTHYYDYKIDFSNKTFERINVDKN